MTAKHAAKWVGGLAAAGLVLLLISIFVADRQLAPPFKAAVLPAVDVPAGEPAAPGVVFFAADTTGSYEIYALPTGDADPDADPAADAAVRLTDDPATDSWRPRLSPDRRTLLFYQTPAGVLDSDLSQASLWMMTADGGAPTEILPPSSHGWTKHGQAEWSPLGTELVMMGERPQGMQIWVTSVDGRDIRNLVNIAGNNAHPSWSPDAKRVLYTACPEAPCTGDQREVFAALAIGGERIQITNDDLLDEQPRFSPDGSQIVMRSRIVAPDSNGEGAVWDVRVVPTNRSTAPTRVVGDGGISGSPVWRDDRTLIFHHYEPDQTTAGIFIARVSDGSIEPLIDGPANDLYPAT